MANLIKVGMADYKVGRAPSTLISYGLGSCIGLSLFDPIKKVGGLLHIMLPDSTQARPSDNPAKFADTGIPLMINDVVALGFTKILPAYFLAAAIKYKPVTTREVDATATHQSIAPHMPPKLPKIGNVALIIAALLPIILVAVAIAVSHETVQSKNF